MSRTPIYRSWERMLTRCRYPRYEHFSRYGGRGISVCEEWRNSFTAFYNWAMSNGYAPELWLDRIDYDGNYSPENCRWVTPKASANNKSNNRFLEYNGESFTVAEWAERLEVNKNTLRTRISRGWSVEDCISVAPLPHGTTRPTMRIGRRCHNGRTPNVR